MRLLITTDTVGGVWTYSRELSEGLLLAGHDILLISMGRAPSRDQLAWTNRTCANWPRTFRYIATTYKLEWMQENARCYFDSEGFLLKQIQRFQPDLLHLNQFCYGALPTDIPKLVVAHSDVISWSECCRGGRPAEDEWFHNYQAMAIKGLMAADAVVAPTQWMLQAVCRNYGPLRRTAVIANGRSLPSHPIAGKKLQAVSTGRLWDEAKNIRLLEQVDSPVPLFVAGDTWLEGERAFSSSKLQLLGTLSEAATLRLFAESSIYIVTSRYEPFGLAPVEAALSGCAIVANDIDSLREVWADVAIYFKDTQDLSWVLRTLTSDGGMLAQTAARAAERAHKYYSREEMVRSYGEIYSSLIAGIAREQEMDIRHVA